MWTSDAPTKHYAQRKWDWYAEEKPALPSSLQHYSQWPWHRINLSDRQLVDEQRKTCYQSLKRRESYPLQQCG